MRTSAKAASVCRALLLGMALDPPAEALDALVQLPDGRPASDAQVLILGHNGVARTGPEGRFTWVPDPRPPFEVLVVLAGGIYSAPFLVERLPADGSPLVIEVRLATSERVTVDGGSTPHTEAPPANASSLVLGADIEQRRPASLTDAIAATPGAGRVGEGHSVVPSRFLPPGDRP